MLVGKKTILFKELGFNKINKLFFALDEFLFFNPKFGCAKRARFSANVQDGWFKIFVMLKESPINGFRYMLHFYVFSFRKNTYPNFPTPILLYQKIVKMSTFIQKMSHIDFDYNT